MAEFVARAALSAKTSRELAEAAAAELPPWRFRIRRELTRASEAYAEQEQALIAALGGRGTAPRAAD